MRSLPLAFIVMASAAGAQDLVMATAPEPIAAIMQDAGLQAQVDKDPTGDPIINSSVAGANFNVFFYGCTSGANCTSVQFNACFKLTTPTAMDVVNKWNSDMRYGKAHLDDKGNTCLKQDIDMSAGIAPDTLKSALSTWSQILGKFTTTIGY